MSKPFFLYTFVEKDVKFGECYDYKFQWELQLWDKEHEKINLESHARYKQDYTKWEQENI